MFDIPAAIESVANLGTTITNKIAPDANEEARNKLTLAINEATNETQLILAQLKINEVEAQHPSIFVAGPRPAIMWVCAAGLGYATVLEPILRFVAQVFCDYTGTFPVINGDLLTPIMLGLLGLGAQRTYEKTKGVETKRVAK